MCDFDLYLDYSKQYLIWMLDHISFILCLSNNSSSKTHKIYNNNNNNNNNICKLFVLYYSCLFFSLGLFYLYCL